MIVTMKQTLPIAGRHFLEVRDHRSLGTELILLLGHGGEEVLIVPFESVHVALFGIGEQVSRLMHPPIGLLDGGEEALRRCQSGSQHVLETTEFVGEPLFCSTRVIESEMLCRRSLSRNPSASRGGRPSSVSALLTARQ